MLSVLSSIDRKPCGGEEDSSWSGDGVSHRMALLPRALDQHSKFQPTAAQP